MNRITIDQYIISLDSAPEEAQQTAKATGASESRNFLLVSATILILVEIENNDVSLVELVQSLGPYLVDEDVKIRVKGNNSTTTISK